MSRAPYPLRPGRLDDLPPGTFAVAIERNVLAAIRDRVLGAAAVERAGVLAGQLVHDRERGAALLEIRDQIAIEAGEGGASMTHFAFGANSFAAARRKIGELSEGVMVAGWWHSHPPCAECPRTPSCRAETIFFSADDAQVHAAAFPATYAVALVAGKLRDRPATDPGIALYAWSEGAVTEVPLRRRASDAREHALAGHVCYQGAAPGAANSGSAASSADDEGSRRSAPRASALGPAGPGSPADRVPAEPAGQVAMDVRRGVVRTAVGVVRVEGHQEPPP
jgi:proteasome lid subunit RPN8/RPN11